ncbi:unnamed protein product [Symbiodinium sp. CCMP2592]|nr:unnamed protein product [Symbiodinium sp. CCMP2592]
MTNSMIAFRVDDYWIVIPDLDELMGGILVRSTDTLLSIIGGWDIKIMEETTGHSGRTGASDKSSREKKEKKHSKKDSKGKKKKDDSSSDSDESSSSSETTDSESSEDKLVDMDTNALTALYGRLTGGIGKWETLLKQCNKVADSSSKSSSSKKKTLMAMIGDEAPDSDGRKACIAAYEKVTMQVQEAFKSQVAEKMNYLGERAQEVANHLERRDAGLTSQKHLRASVARVEALSEFSSTAMLKGLTKLSWSESSTLTKSLSTAAGNDIMNAGYLQRIEREVPMTSALMQHQGLAVLRDEKEEDEPKEESEDEDKEDSDEKSKKKKNKKQKKEKKGARGSKKEKEEYPGVKIDADGVPIIETIQDLEAYSLSFPEDSTLALDWQEIMKSRIVTSQLHHLLGDETYHKWEKMVSVSAAAALGLGPSSEKLTFAAPKLLAVASQVWGIIPDDLSMDKFQQLYVQWRDGVLGDAQIAAEHGSHVLDLLQTQFAVLNAGEEDTHQLLRGGLEDVGLPAATEMDGGLQVPCFSWPSLALESADYLADVKKVTSKDGPEVERALQDAFEKEEADGQVAEARKRYPGSSLRIAALAVMTKPDQDFRVLHDGTHGVQVNNDILMKDRLQSPGAREASAIELWRIELGVVSEAQDWQIAVTHFPPLWGMQFWQGITKKYGIDLMITGHTHHQRLWAPWGNNPLGGTAVIISGGGGGITSEEVPDLNGWDDEYGFFKLELHRTEIIIRGVSHGAQLRKELRLYQLQPSYHIPPRDSSPALAAAAPGTQDPDHDYKEEPNHARIKEATKQSKIEDLLDQLENARQSEMKKDDFMKIRKLSTVDPSRIYGMDMENVSEQLV